MRSEEEVRKKLAQAEKLAEEAKPFTIGLEYASTVKEVLRWVLELEEDLKIERW